MADRVSASIVLGGTITAAAFAQLAALAEREGLSTDWDGEPFQPDHLIPDQPLRLGLPRFSGQSGELFGYVLVAAASSAISYAMGDLYPREE